MWNAIMQLDSLMTIVFIFLGCWNVKKDKCLVFSNSHDTCPDDYPVYNIYYAFGRIPKFGQLMKDQVLPVKVALFN